MVKRHLLQIFFVLLGSFLTGSVHVRAQDPVAVAPDVFRTLLENERVRVLEQRLGKGFREPMHSHPAYVKYTLSSYKGTTSYRNGSTSTVRRINKGQTMWFDAETHAQKNTGTTEAHAIFVELKGAHVVQAEKQTNDNDPLTVDPKTHKRLLENERVRVMEFRLKPGESTATHHHRDGVFYILNGGTIIETLSNGKTNEATLTNGDVKWTDAKSHRVKNTGSTEVKMLIVELKD